MKKMIWIVFFSSIAVILGGCNSISEQSTHDNKLENSLVIECSLANCMIVSENVLKNLCFVIDKRDVDAGYISTRSLSAGQLPEFWRRDNVGVENIIEANIQSLVRSAYITVEDFDGKLKVDCVVEVQRLNIDAPQADMFSALSNSVTSSSTMSQKLYVSQDSKAGDGKIVQSWVKLGRDAMLEDYIINEIRNEISK